MWSIAWQRGAADLKPEAWDTDDRERKGGDIGDTLSLLALEFTNTMPESSWCSSLATFNASSMARLRFFFPSNMSL